jgi:CheY-like chemotaxis protein
MPTNSTTLPNPSGQTILIVEDEFAVANNLNSILEKAGYSISGIAFSVDEALEMNRQKRPDLVLLDIHLKGAKTGIDLAHLLAKDDIPFVYVSANTNASILEEVKNNRALWFSCEALS